MSLARALMSRVDRREQGVTVILVALMLVPLLLFVAFVVDLGNARQTRRQAQNAADAAALAAVREVTSGNPVAVGRSYVTANGFPGADTALTEVHVPPTTGPAAGNQRCVEVITRTNVPTFFAGVVDIPSLNVRGRAVACETTGFGGGYAIFAHSSTCDKTIDWSGSNFTVNGQFHSNRDIDIGGSQNLINGAATYRTSATTDSSKVTYNPAVANPQLVAPVLPYPVNFDINDYKPGGSRAQLAVSQGRYHNAGNAKIDSGWLTSNGKISGNTLAPGLYYTTNNIEISISNLIGTGVTFVSSAESAGLGTIDLSGSDLTITPWDPDGLQAFRTSRRPGTPAAAWASSSPAATWTSPARSSPPGDDRSLRVAERHDQRKPHRRAGEDGRPARQRHVRRGLRRWRPVDSAGRVARTYDWAERLISCRGLKLRDRMTDGVRGGQDTLSRRRQPRYRRNAWDRRAARTAITGDPPPVASGPWSTGRHRRPRRCGDGRAPPLRGLRGRPRQRPPDPPPGPERGGRSRAGRGGRDRRRGSCGHGPDLRVGQRPPRADPALTEVHVPPVSGPRAGNPQCVEVTTGQNVPTFFTGVINISSLDVQARAVACETSGVGGGYAIFAGSTTCQNAIDWSGSSTTVEGRVHSNHDIHVGGQVNVVEGIVTYVSNVDAPADKITYVPSVGNPQLAGVLPYPVNFTIADYGPGGARALLAQSQGRYYDAGNAKIDMGWLTPRGLWNDGTNALAPGLYYTTGDIDLPPGVVIACPRRADPLTTFAGTTAPVLLRRCGSSAGRVRARDNYVTRLCGAESIDPQPPVERDVRTLRTPARPRPTGASPRPREAPAGPARRSGRLGGEVGPGRLGLGLGRELAGAVVGADVVALLVVGVLAEVLAVLGRHLAALGRLLDRQADAAALQVDVDDLDPQLLARRDDLLGQVDVVRRHLRDVHQALDALAHLDEGAEGHELGDPAVDELADAVGVGELLPRVLLGGLEREADALAVEVDLEHLRRRSRRRPARPTTGGRRASTTARTRARGRPCRRGRRRRRS